MTKNNKEKTIINSLAGVMAVITILAIFAVVILRQTAAQEEKDQKVAQAMQQIQQEQEEQKSQPQPVQQEASAVQFELPQEMKAAQVSPGREFLSELAPAIEQAQLRLSGEVLQQEQQSVQPDEEEVYRQLEQLVEQAAQLGLNTLFVSTENAYGTLWDSPAKMVSFDLLGSLCDLAHQQGIAVYGLCDLSLVAGTDGRMHHMTSVNAKALDRSAEQLAAIASQRGLDGLLLDGYLNEQGQYSYDEYAHTGANVSLKEYMTGSTELLVQTAVQTVRQQNPELPVGLAVSPVWATADEQPDGIDLAYTRTSLGAYNADSKGMIEKGLADFVVVKNYGATGSDQLPFEPIADWWSDTLSQAGVTGYMGHASSRAGSWENGWGPNSELADQWKITQQEEGFCGSVFNSLEALLKDVNYTTYYLKEAWEQESSGDQMTAQAGSGSFSQREDLFAGLTLLEEVTPVGNYSVADGDTIDLVAIAMDGAQVVATVNGETLTLKNTGRSGGISGYRKFTASYDVEGKNVSSSGMGSIVFIASMDGKTESLTGAKLTFQGPTGSYGSNDKGNSSSNSSSSSSSSSSGGDYTGTIRYNQPSLSTSSSKSIGDGTLVQVVSEQALTFPVNKNSIYPDTSCYPLPYGTMDYVVGSKVSVKDGSSYRHYYKLASGRRVYCEDVQAVTGGISIKNNSIRNMTVKANKDFTYVILQSDYPVSYLPEYSSGRLRFDFQNTTSTPGDLSLNQNPLFSSASWKGSTLTLELLDDGSFLGYKAYHENGNIVLRFNNPTGIEGARITVDPGHGGSDPGVADDIDPNWPEKRINWELSKAIAQELEDRGAKVNLLNTYNNTTSLDSRLAQAKNFDSSLFLCIHTNSSETNSAAVGSECYYFYPFAKKLATRIPSASADGLSTTDRGAKYDVFYVTRDPQMVGILGEIGFLSNAKEYSKMQKDSYQQQVGEEIAQAVEKYLDAAGAKYAGRTGTQSTGKELNASNGPACSLDGKTASSQGSSSSAGGSSSGSSSSGNSSNNGSSSSSSGSTSSSKPSGNSSSSSTERPAGPVSETVVVKGSSNGKVKYIIFTDPENKKLTLKAGQEKQLGIKLTGDDKVTRKYTTSDKYVATIDKDGVVHAVGAGTCKITVVAGDQGGSIEVKVTGGSSSGSSSANKTDKQPEVPDVVGKKVETTGITIKASSTRVEAGKSIQLQVIFSPSNATGEEIVWSVYRGSLYGSVDGRGVFTGIESGYSTVRATTADGKYSATMRIEII